jgi:hypothetical protein
MGKTHSKDVSTDQILKGFNVIWGQSIKKCSLFKVQRSIFLCLKNVVIAMIFSNDIVVAHRDASNKKGSEPYNNLSKLLNKNLYNFTPLLL